MKKLLLDSLPIVALAFVILVVPLFSQETQKKVGPINNQGRTLSRLNMIWPKRCSNLGLTKARPYSISLAPHSYSMSFIWTEDNAPLITTPEEKEIFAKLSTEAERAEFIDDYWKRRDPTPETPENECKLDYYDRVAYADSSYGFVYQKGRYTERGITYIIYGQPDEIKEEAADEVWRYRFENGAGLTFRFGSAFSCAQAAGYIGSMVW